MIELLLVCVCLRACACVFVFVHVYGVLVHALVLLCMCMCARAVMFDVSITERQSRLSFFSSLLIDCIFPYLGPQRFKASVNNRSRYGENLPLACGCAWLY